MNRIKVWDPFVRVFHWSLAAGFAANALLIEGEAKLHEQIGYSVAALIALRLVWGLVGTRHARFTDFPPSASGALGQLSDLVVGQVRQHLGHTPLGALMIYNLLVTIAALAATGWLMTTDAYWGAEWLEEAHEALATWAEVSVVAHIAGVLFESRRTGVNLPKSMVTGYKEMPAPVAGRPAEP